MGRQDSGDMNGEGYTQDQLAQYARQSVDGMSRGVQFKFVTRGDPVPANVQMQVYPIPQGGEVRAGYDSDQNVCYVFWNA